MKNESFDPSRRRFLIEMSAAGSVLALAGVVAATQILEASSYSRQRRDHLDPLHTPHFKDIVVPGSMLTGIAPYNNDFKGLSHPADYGIVNLFASWKEWSLNGHAYSALISQIPMISILPFDQDHPGGFTYKEISEQKQLIRTQAQKLSPFNKCYLRYGYEMNASWYRDGRGKQTPQQYVDGWRLIAEIVKKMAPRVELVWCPNVGYSFEKYYPGDDYVDVVALDAYNKYHPDLFHARHFHPNLSFSELCGPDIRLLQDMCHKPIMIAELGIDQGAGNLPWLVDAYNKAAMFDRVFAVCLFAWNKQNGRFDYQEADWANMLTDELHYALTDNVYYKTGNSL